MKNQDVERMAALIKKNILDITAAVTGNMTKSDDFALLAAYSGLTSVLSYFDFKLRDAGISDKAITETREGAEEYVLKLIAEELNLGLQKSGKA